MPGIILTTETGEEIKVRAFTLMFCSAVEEEEQFMEWIEQKSQLNESSPDEIMKNILMFNAGMCNMLHDLEEKPQVKS